MIATNPHPLANPLNRQRYAAYERVDPRKTNVIAHASNPKDLTPPESSMSYEDVMNAQHSLTVPQTAPDIAIASVSQFGFIGNSSLFRLHDGSILDLKSHKVVFDPNSNIKDSRCWSQTRILTHPCDMDKSWHKSASIESMLMHPERYADGLNDANGPNVSSASRRYWDMAREESKKLEQNMTDEQKKLIDELNSEQFFPLSRLEEENPSSASL